MLSRRVLTTLCLTLAACGTEPAPLDARDDPGPTTTQAAAEPHLLASRLDAAITVATWEPPVTTTTTAPPPPPTTTTTAPAPAPAPLPTGACGGWEGLIAAHFPPSQVSKACAVMGCETGYTWSPTIPNRQGSGASGLFQFMPGTWSSVTGTPPPAANYPPETQIAAAAALWASSGWSPWDCA